MGVHGDIHARCPFASGKGFYAPVDIHLIRCGRKSLWVEGGGSPFAGVGIEPAASVGGMSSHEDGGLWLESHRIDLRGAAMTHTPLIRDGGG